MVGRSTARAGRSGKKPAKTRRIASRGGDRTRARILAAALRVFAEDGFDGATTRRIAARARVNLGLITYYFGSKEQLWRAAVNRVFDALWTALASVDLSADPARVLRTCVRFVAANPDFVRLMNDEGKREGPRMRWLADRHNKRLFQLVTTALESAGGQRRVPHVEPMHLFYILIGSVGMIFSQAPECRRLTGVDPTATEGVAEAHADALVRLFLGRRWT